MNQLDDFYRRVLDNIFDGVYFVDVERRITYWNKGAEQISGYSPQEVIGRHCYEQILRHTNEEGISLCKTGCSLAAAIQDGKPREIEVYLHHKDGYRLPVRVRAQPVYDDQGMIIGAVEIFNDNSLFVATRHRLQEYQHAAHRDSLTNLGNRRFSEINLVTAFQSFRQVGERFGVLLIDIDDFKQINDTYGHLVGDDILKLVADTLRYGVRSSDYVGRWGGEEFLVILYDIPEHQMFAIAEKLRHLMEHNTLVTEKGEIGVTIAIGGTSVCADDTLKSILLRADENLYQSKREGKNRSTIK
ncbi:MAG: GGDEF domain-containing protein [Anaerolineales bacterium]